jgi:hypothetical protein
VIIEGWAKKYAGILLRYSYEVHSKMPEGDEFHKMIIPEAGSKRKES